MIAEPTHISSDDGKIVVAVEDLSAEDLRHLLALKLAEPETEKAREDHEMRRRLWQLLRKMPKHEALELAARIADEDPGLLLDVYLDAILTAVFGPGPVRTVGWFKRHAREGVA